MSFKNWQDREEFVHKWDKRFFIGVLLSMTVVLIPIGLPLMIMSFAALVIYDS